MNCGVYPTTAWHKINRYLSASCRTKLIIRLVFLLTFAAFCASGQSALNIQGQIRDTEGVPIAFANVALYESADSVFRGGGVSDDNGFFSIPAKAGSYYLKITFLSYEEKTIGNI